MHQSLRFSIIIIMSFYSLAAKAQFNISGRITDGTSTALKSIEFHILNTKNESATVNVFTDSNGYYSANLPATENLKICVTQDGYIPSEQALIFSSDTLVLDIILEEKTNLIKEISVTAKKPMFERKADRTIFHVQESIAAAGSNALDMLKKAPGIIVQQQDYSIQLAGKSSVMVMINDRMILLSAEDLFAYLQGIPAENIERIEVITTPPARYDAAGNSGLVNIILKKNTKLGINGDLRLAYEQSCYGTLLSGANINYRKNKVNFYANANYTNSSKNITERMSTEYPDQTFNISDPYKRITDIGQATAGLDYQLSKKSIAGIQLSTNNFQRTYLQPNSDIVATHRPENTIDSIIRSKGISVMNNSTQTMNLNYVYDIDTSGKKLSFNANKLWYNGNREKNYSSSRFYGAALISGNNETQNKNTGEQEIGITTAQADLELPFKKWSLNLGSKWSSTTNESRNHFYNYWNNEFVDDPIVSNEFHYKEQVEAFYLSGSKSVKKWEMQLGLRTEFTQTDGYSVQLAQRNTNSYYNIFPTAYVVYKKNEQLTFNLNYSKRIYRPGYRSLDPYRSYSSPYSYVEGNPFLKPNILHNIEMGITIKNNYSISAYFQSSPHSFGQVFFADTAQKTSYVKTQEYGNFYTGGLNFSATFHFIKNMESNFQSNISVAKVNATYTSTPIKGALTPIFWISMNNSFPLNKSKTLMLQANAFYISNHLNDLMKRQPQLNADAGFRAILFHKKLTISLSSNDLFRTLKVKATNSISGQKLDSYFDEQNVRLNINYKFGNNKVKERRMRDSGIEEEKQRT